MNHRVNQVQQRADYTVKRVHCEGIFKDQLPHISNLLFFVEAAEEVSTRKCMVYPENES